MFDPEALAALASRNRATLDLICGIEDRLNERFYAMEDAIHCMMLAAMTGESMVMIGPPGTAKSRLIRSFCNLIGILSDDALMPSDAPAMTLEVTHDAYFEYLLTQFTEPSELFGYFDLPKLFDASKPELVRETVNMMTRAKVVFLDEVFNASSAILNALLTFMNERRFHDRGQRVHTPLRLLFSATNHTPQDEGLRAVYDRFLLRCWMENVPAKPTHLSSMLTRAWTETHATKIDPDASRAFSTLLEKLDVLRADIDQMTSRGELAIRGDDTTFALLADTIEVLRRNDMSQVSNRRLVKFSAVFLVEALLAARRRGDDLPFVGPESLETLLRFGLDREDHNVLAKARQHLGISA